jgi:putative hydrolase of the HAD superfamily
VSEKSAFDGIRLILFDLDGTLRDVRPTSLQALVAYGTDLGLSFDLEERRAAIRWSHEYWAGNRAVIRYDRQRLGKEAFLELYLRQYLKALGVDHETGNSEAAVVTAIVARFREEFSPEPYLEPGAKELLWNLREAGLTLGLVSNRDEPLTGIAIELGIIEHFNFTLAAGQVDSWKPDAAIFQHALRMGGDVAPREAVYVGDNYFADVVGARGAGIRAVLVDKEGAFPETKDECLIISKLGELKDAVPDRSSQANY